MPWRGSFSTGLPSRHPAARPSQAPCTRSAKSSAGVATAEARPGRAPRSRRGRPARRRASIAGPATRSSSASRRPGEHRAARRSPAPRSPRRSAPEVAAGRFPALARPRSTSQPSSRSAASTWAHEVLGLHPGEAEHARPTRRRGPPHVRASGATSICATAVIVAAGATRSMRLAVDTASHPLRRDRSGAAEGAGDRPGHRGDRVGVTAVVDGAEDGVAVVAAGRRRSRGRRAAPRSTSCGSGGGRRAAGWR